MDRPVPELPPRWTRCRGCASRQTGCICERGGGVHVFATSSLGQGDGCRTGVFVCVCTWNLRGVKMLARTCINNAAVCVVVHSFLMCIYIQHSSSANISNNSISNSYVKHGSFLRDFFSRGILMLKKIMQQRLPLSLWPQQPQSWTAEKEQLIQWHFVSYNITYIIRSNEAVHQEWLHKIKRVTSSLFFCRYN